jgi:4a-hydroxytetrahydrobiopterin dehydratase
MTVLNDDTIRTQLESLPGWELSDGALQRDFTFANFSEAFAFMTRVALIAEKLDHHPDWSNSWNQVHIGISSHAQGGITDQCFELASRIGRLVEPPA